MLDTVKAAPFTFYSKPVYARIGRSWTGIGMGFIMLLTLISLVSTGFAMRPALQNFSSKVDDVMDAMPQSTLKDHVLSIDRPVPYVVKLFQDENTPNKIAFDTTNTESSVDVLRPYMKKENVLVFITAKHMFFMQQKELRVDDFDSMPDGAITHDDWMKVGETVKFWTLPVTVFFLAVFLFLGNLILVLIAAVVARLFAAIMRVPMDYATGMRVSAAAGLPGALFILFVPLPFWVKLLIWMIYIGFAVSALRAKPANISV